MYPQRRRADHKKQECWRSQKSLFFHLFSHNDDTFVCISCCLCVFFWQQIKPAHKHSISCPFYFTCFYIDTCIRKPKCVSICIQVLMKGQVIVAEELIQSSLVHSEDQPLLLRHVFIHRPIHLLLCILKAKHKYSTIMYSKNRIRTG